MPEDSPVPASTLATLPTRRLKRRHRRTIRLALKFVLELWWLRKTRWLRSPARHDAKQSALYRRQARQFRDYATKTGGLIIKIGQFLSVRIDLLPEEYTTELAALQDAIPPVPTSVIVGVIETELGQPIDQAFAEFDDEPLAAASLGQVHRARLTSGQQVAVKVLRPGVEDLVETDLQSLDTVLRLLSRITNLDQLVDRQALFEEAETTFRRELDYHQEGHSAETFQANFLLNPNVDIPQIFWDQSNGRVLTMEFMNGVKINDFAALDAQGLDRTAIARHFFELYLQMFLKDGLYHADPHPGNVFVRADGVIQLIDFGMVGRIDEPTRRHLADLITATLRRQPDDIVVALRQLGFLRPDTDARQLARHLLPLFDIFAANSDLRNPQTPFLTTLTGGTTSAAQWQVNSETLNDLRDFIFTQPINLPSQMAFLGKALITVTTTCDRLDPNFDLVAVATPYLKQGEANDFLQNMIGRLIRDGVSFIQALPPAARQTLSLIGKLDQGELELGLAQTQFHQLMRLQRYHQRRLLQALFGAVVTLGGLLVALLSPQLALGLVISALGLIALLWSQRRQLL
ncbi:MAG: hypothetical protein LBL92_04025 [Propionibacteriaceae bacterium]|jgi:predicted unusual protein kinase regulating ubiquinone biosynthesis (AarF/ABC1/UbiB family)|nr:hypothetical protein [Propionibacteriaceae bacterium]